ncbi:MAG: phosphatidylserine decarboxylase-domain-containing protein [Benniella sp.]|nr:MAG: phosphatidylserine decarboxylase-domain-containing protein [Benniella sp.]
MQQNTATTLQVSGRMRIHIARARGLAIKDANGLSDPYVKVKIGGHRFTTHVVYKTLDPVWDASFEFNVEPQSLPEKVELMFWDKDRFTKDDFMGAVDIPFQESDLWADAIPMHFDDAENKARWHPLTVREGLSTNVFGDVEIKFGFIDTTLSPTSEHSRAYCRELWNALQSGKAEFGTSLGQIRNSVDGGTIAIAEIPLAVGVEDPSLGYSDVHQDSVLGSTPATTTNSLHGLVFMEIVSAANLPEMPNALRTGYDMDPFVVISFGKYIFRTRVIRHDRNPVWKAKLMFRVHHGEETYEIKFSIHDWDAMSDNDRVGYLTIPVNELIQAGDQADALPTLPVADGVQNDPDLKDYIRPIIIDESIGDNVKATAEGAQFRFLAKFVPYTVLRKRFWYGLAVANGIEDPRGPYSKVLIQNMLEGLGSTVCEETIDGFFKKYNKTPEQGLEFDELYECLEQRIKLADGEAAKDPDTPFYKRFFRRSKVPHGDQGDQSPTTSHTHEHEQVIRISTCPICNDPSLREKLETDVITHIAVCAGNDGFNLDKLIMSDLGTEANARRKSITKFVKSLGYGKYIVGESNANIIVQERVTGERIEEKMPTSLRLGIRLLYQSSANKMIARKTLARLSRRQGAKYDDPRSKHDIEPFIRFHNLQKHMAEEVKVPEKGFSTFNEFFYRPLKEGARKLSNPEDNRVAVSAADCRMTCFATISEATEFWIKGNGFTVAKLLDDADLAKKFDGGSLVIFRLAPQDYHRFHIPVAGQLSPPHEIDGALYTVNPMAIRRTLDVYGENKRVVNTIESDEFGTVAYVSIGAMMVGSIVLTTAKEGQQVKRMDEHGYFAFGGSTIVVLFEPNSIKFDDDLLETSRQQVEMLVKVGMRIGVSTR